MSAQGIRRCGCATLSLAGLLALGGWPVSLAAAPLAPESPAPVPAREGVRDPGTVVLGNTASGGAGTAGQAQNLASGPDPAQAELERERLFEESLRELLPVAPEDVERYLEARDALEGATEPAPATMRGRTRVLEAGVPKSPEVVRLTRGYSSTLLFQDVTGAPWPVLSAILGDPGAFALTQPRVEQGVADQGPEGNRAQDGQERDGSGQDGSGRGRPGRNVHSHLVNIVPLTNHASSNLVLTLEGAEYPVVLHLVTESARTRTRTSDALTVFRLARSGPNARAAPLGPAESGLSEDLLSLVHGIAPAGARRMRLEPGDDGITVWEYANRYCVRTIYQAVWPAWIASAAMEGYRLYVMPRTPSLVVAKDGRRQSYKILGQSYGTGP